MNVFPLIFQEEFLVTGLEFDWVELKKKLNLKFGGKETGKLKKLLSATLVQRCYFDASS